MIRLPTSGRHWAVCLLVPLLGAGAPALADPPAWAPAHGYHKNHPKKGRGGERADPYLPWHGGPAQAPYLDEGSCNRKAVGAVVGGVVGGVVGSQVGKGDGRTLATVAGTVIGVLVGSSIGRSMDQADRYCAGQALEYTPDQQPVVWQNPDDRQQYSVRPVKTYQRGDGRYCREYITEAQVAGSREQTYGTACRQPDGSWEIMG